MEAETKNLIARVNRKLAEQEPYRRIASRRDRGLYLVTEEAMETPVYIEDIEYMAREMGVRVDEEADVEAMTPGNDTLSSDELSRLTGREEGLYYEHLNSVMDAEEEARRLAAGYYNADSVAARATERATRKLREQEQVHANLLAKIAAERDGVAIWLTTEEAADFLEITPSRLRKDRHQGKVHAHPDGLGWRWDLSEVRDYLFAKGRCDRPAGADRSAPPRDRENGLADSRDAGRPGGHNRSSRTATAVERERGGS